MTHAVLTARYFMPQVPAGYSGRIHVVLPEVASDELVAWCKKRTEVRDVWTGTFEPTSLAIALGYSETTEAGQQRIHNLVAQLSEQTGYIIHAFGEYMFYGQIQRLKEQGPPKYTPELQFMLELGWTPEWTWHKPLPFGLPGIGWIDAPARIPGGEWFTYFPASIWTHAPIRHVPVYPERKQLLSEHKPYDIPRWQQRSLRRWLSQQWFSLRGRELMLPLTNRLRVLWSLRPRWRKRP